MMEDPRDFDHRRRFDEQGYPVGPRQDSGYVPAILLVALLIIGGYFVLASGSKVQTASNEPAVERSAPAPTSPASPKQ